MTKEKIIKIGGKEFSPEQVQGLIDSGLIAGQKNDTLQSNFAQVPHGFSLQYPSTGGLFTRPTSEADIYAIVVGVVGTLANQLYQGTSILLQPEFELLTGVDAAGGSNPTSFAGTAPVPGAVKAGTYRANFGKFYMSTEKFMLPQEGGYANRGDVDRRVLNALYDPILNPLMFSIPQNINTFTGLSLYSMAVHYQRVTSRVLFNGNATQANTATEIGYIKEFDGLDRLIKTGYVDLETGNTIPAVDSTVFDFGSTDVTTAAGTDKIVSVLAEIYFKLTSLAEDTGMPITQWTLAMRRDTFYAITEVYPRSYLTIGNNMTSDSNGNRVMVSGGEITNFRDTMRREKFLWIMGERVPVSIETGIPKEAVDTGWKAPIYFIPMTSGGRKVTYLEGFDQGNAAVMEFVNLTQARYRTENNGLWALAHNQTNFAWELLVAQQLRLVLRTPQLAARIENVVYNFNESIYPRDAYPDEAYYANGGRYVSAPYSAV